MNLNTLTIALLASTLYSAPVLANSSGVEQIETSILPHVRVTTEQYAPQTIEEAMAATSLPGVSIAVVSGGELVWAKGFGLADKNTKRQVSTETLFQAGSISKPLAALAVLHLAEHGLVDLDTDVNRYLKSWKVPKSDLGIITIRHLLTHTSGLSQHGFPGYKRGEKMPSDVEVLTGKGNTDTVIADIKAGTKFRYSGGGYTVMELLVEEVTGQSFSDFADANILKPLAMTNSTFAQPLPKSMWPKASAAFNDKGEQIEGDWHNYPEQAAAGLWTTPTDLAKYVIAVQNAKKGITTGPMTPKLVEQMLTLHIGDMGLGPMLQTKEQGQVFHHSGKNAGFSNRLSAYSEKGEGMIIMTNGDSARTVVSQIQNAISEHFGWDLSAPRTVTPFVLNSKQRQAIAGSYEWELDASVEIHISQKANEFEVHLPFQGNTFRFIAEQKDRLIAKSTGVNVELEIDDKGDVTAIVWDGMHRLVKK